MAINKKLIHFKNFSDFNSKKLSANENNTQYTLGINGAVTNGSPDILYQSICWIKDTKQQWTHGQLYDCTGGSSVDLSEYLTANEIAEIYATTESLNEKQDMLVSGANIKTINGESILGSGTINVAQCTSTGEYVIARGIFNDYDVVEIDTDGITFIPEGSSDNIPGAPQQWSIHRDGDGTKFLSDDGTYKEAGGGNSNANVQAVDTGDVIDDVNVEYATKTYVDGLVGDINSVLESIING